MFCFVYAAKAALLFCCFVCLVVKCSFVLFVCEVQFSFRCFVEVQLLFACEVQCSVFVKCSGVLLLFCFVCFVCS